MTSTPKLELGDDQRFALMKFRRNIADCTLPASDDYYLLRWLKARNFNPEAAEKMLRESLRWRESVDADHMVTDWTPPAVMTKYYPGGICGVDMDHIPVIFFPFSGFDVIGLIQSTNKADFLKNTARDIEICLQEASRISRGLGRPASAPQIVVIYDLEGLELKHFTFRPALEVLYAWANMFEANYPEILKKCVIINAPTVFSILLSIVKPFLHDNTLKKLQIFGSSAHKWRTYLLEHIHADQLPVYLGGTMTGPGGDPRCSDKIRQGGKVPKSMYLKNQAKCGDPGNVWSTASVKKQQRLRINFNVSPRQSGSFLKWKFYADSCDVQFAVYQGGDTCSVVEPRLVASTSQSSPEVGLYQCQQPSNYIVEFENVSSSRGCQVHYQILLTESVAAVDKDSTCN